MQIQSIRMYVYTGLFHVSALIFTFLAIVNFDLGYDLKTSLGFILWIGILYIARLEALPQLIGTQGEAMGWAITMEFACLIAFPFHLFCIAIITSGLVVALLYMYQNRRELIGGSCFNSAQLIVAGGITSFVLTSMETVLSGWMLASIVSLLAASLVYWLITIMSLTVFHSIQLKVKRSMKEMLKRDMLIISAILVLIGASIGYACKIEPFLILLILLPLYLLHKIVGKIHQSKLIYIDEKTGLYNYRYFDESLNQMFSAAQRRNEPLSIVFGDMDYLRDINNNYGHPVGDKAIIAIANIFKEKGGHGNIAARFGGEEFVLIVPNHKQAAVEIAESIRKAAMNTKLSVEGKKEIRLSISIGVATFPYDANTMEELVKASDDALYIAKQLGRNRVQAYQANMQPNVLHFSSRENS